MGILPEVNRTSLGIMLFHFPKELIQPQDLHSMAREFPSSLRLLWMRHWSVHCLVGEHFRINGFLHGHGDDP